MIDKLLKTYPVLKVQQPANGDRMKVVAIGDVNVDLILPLRLPRVGKQVVVGDFQMHGGGCAANFALACAKLGARSKLVGRVADDVFGKFVLGELRRQGVDVRDVVVSEGGKTGVTLALVEGVERSFVTYRGENATFSMKDVNFNRLDADLVHLPSFFLMEKLRPDCPKLIRRIKGKTGGIVSFDTGWNPFGWGKGIRNLKEVLRQVDIFLPNVDEARGILASGRHRSEGALLRGLLDLGVKVVAMKMGNRGSLISDGYKTVKLPTFKVEVVDTTGAGDVFNAAFVVAYLRGHDITEAGKFANAAAALSITGAGWSKYPTLGQVNDFLGKHRTLNRVFLTNVAA